MNRGYIAQVRTQPVCANLRRRMVTVELLGVLVLVLFMAGTHYFPSLFAIALVSGLVLLALYLVSVKCPKCSYPVLKREKRTGIGHLTVWVGWPPKCCSRCGTPFSAATLGDTSS